MRKGFIDMWTMIGIFIMLMVFALLLYIQQVGQHAIEPSLVAGILISGRRRP